MKRKEFKGFYRVIQDEGRNEIDIAESCKSLRSAKKKAQGMTNRTIYRYSRNKGWAGVSGRWELVDKLWVRCKWNKEWIIPKQK